MWVEWIVFQFEFFGGKYLGWFTLHRRGYPHSSSEMRAEQFFSLSFFSSLSGRSRELCGSFSFQADEQFRGLLAADQGIVHLDCRSNSKINAAEGTISKGYFQSPSAIYPLYRGGESLSQRPGQVVIFGRSSLYLLRHLVEGSWLVTQSPEVSFCQGWWQHLRQRELAGGGLPAGVLRAALAYRVGSFPPLAPWLSKIKISSAVCQFAIMSQIWIWVFLRLRLAAGVVMRVIISHWAFFHTPCHSHLGFTRLLLLLAPFNRMESLRLQEETHPPFYINPTWVSLKFQNPHHICPTLLWHHR